MLLVELTALKPLSLFCAKFGNKTLSLRSYKILSNRAWIVSSEYSDLKKLQIIRTPSAFVPYTHGHSKFNKAVPTGNAMGNQWVASELCDTESLTIAKSTVLKAEDTLRG